MPNAAASPHTENIFPGRQHLLLREVKGINRVSSNKNESLLTFKQNNIL
ncbi:hypothetical protein OA48_12970 [Klebsiella variicola]|nr:hypothetical protein OA48_12970 [Klebsiella variicola]